MLDSLKLNRESKIKFILRALDTGWSVTKAKDKENAYEFEIDKEKLMEKPDKNIDKGTDKSERRSVSLPVSKNEVVRRLFKM
jgi:hypothetical protein